MSYFRERMAEIDAERKSRKTAPEPAAAKSDDGWKPWNSWGPQPVPDHVMVEVKLRDAKDGRVRVGTAAQFGRKYHGKEICWRHVGDKHDIIAYRVVAPSVKGQTDG